MESVKRADLVERINKVFEEANLETRELKTICTYLESLDKLDDYRRDYLTGYICGFTEKLVANPDLIQPKVKK